MNDVTTRIRERLDDLDISEREAERRAGLGEGYIRNIKTGKARTHLDGKFEALARDGLQCSAIWLRTGKGDKSLAGDASYDERLRFVLETFDSLDEQEQQAVEAVMRSYIHRKQTG
jgi:transcriptional regulator with XRE-family HTH domain